jgi:mono/diheme cytochrome c family protein
MRLKITCAALIISAGCSQAANATAAQDRAAKGHALAKQWCSSCHIVEPGTTSASDVAPPFPKVAQDKRLTPDKLRAWLRNPHPPMPNLSLSREEIENLVAYIGSLRPSQ